jgi:hypothetical protein
VKGHFLRGWPVLHSGFLAIIAVELSNDFVGALVDEGERHAASIAARIAFVPGAACEIILPFAPVKVKLMLTLT